MELFKDSGVIADDIQPSSLSQSAPLTEDFISPAGLHVLPPAPPAMAPNVPPDLPSLSQPNYSFIPTPIQITLTMKMILKKT